MTTVRETLEIASKESLALAERINEGLSLDADGFFAPPLNPKHWRLIERALRLSAAAPGEPCAWYDPTLSDPDHPFITAVNKRALDSRKSKAWSIPLYTTPQPAAGWHEAIEAAAGWHESEAAHAKVIYSEMDRYSDVHEERAGWRSYKDKEDRHLSYAAHIRSLRREASAPAATPHGKGSDAASVAIPVASSDLLVSQEAPVLSEPSPPADRREIVARIERMICEGLGYEPPEKWMPDSRANRLTPLAQRLAALDGGR